MLFYQEICEPRLNTREDLLPCNEKCARLVAPGFRYAGLAALAYQKTPKDTGFRFPGVSITPGRFPPIVILFRETKTDGGGEHHEGHKEHEGWNLTVYPTA